MRGHGKEAFKNFVIKYYSRCENYLPNSQMMIGAKWPFTSMIPDLSDFDGRIIAGDDIKPENWQVLDEAIGNIHYEMVLQNPEWVRFLEHPAGICITWKEAFADDIYHPETVHWSYIMGEEQRFKELQEHLQNKPWENRQEYYYLQRFLYYYSPYLHDIDPPINLGAWKEHYALHSRAFHYFVPAMQAALSLIRKKAVRCKFETLYGWKELLPKEKIFDKILDMVNKKYNVPELKDKAKMLKLEDEMFEYLKKAMEIVRGTVTIIDMKDGASAEECKKRLAKYKVNPLMHIFDGVRFSRVRKGRYQFYLREPKPFDSDWLIANEFAWLRNFFTKRVYQAYGQIKCNQNDASLDTIIEAMKPDLIDNNGEEIVRTIHRLSWAESSRGKEKELLHKIVPIFWEYRLILESMLSEARKLTKGTQFLVSAEN